MLKNWKRTIVKHQQDKHADFEPLAEFMVEDILSASDEQLLAEAAEDYGSATTFSDDFDSIILSVISGSKIMARRERP